jgi:hypothetical protein
VRALGGGAGGAGGRERPERVGIVCARAEADGSERGGEAVRVDRVRCG